MQSKRHSLVEAAANTLIGYVINLGVQLIVYPIYGAVFTLSEKPTTRFDISSSQLGTRICTSSAVQQENPCPI